MSGELKDIDARDQILDQTPLWYAASLGHVEAVQALLSFGVPDVNWTDVYRSQTPLICAIAQGHSAVAQLLLRNSRVDIDVQDGRGQTALMHAAIRGTAEVAKVLLEEGASTGTQDAMGRTALSYASTAKTLHVLELLLKPGLPEIQLVDNDGRTPLHTAALYGNLNAATLLMDIGLASINTQDELCCRTALSYAAEKGHEAVVRRLLERKANPHIDDEFGRTPISYAAEKNHMGVVQILLETDPTLINTEDIHQRRPLTSGDRRAQPHCFVAGNLKGTDFDDHHKLSSFF